MVVEAQASGLHCVVSDTVPQDAFLTDLIQTESIFSKPSAWAQRIAPYAVGYERKDTSKQIIAAGYDIAESAGEFEQFYLSMSGF